MTAIKTACQLRNQTFELVPLERLHPHPRNPRQGDVDAIRESLTSHGWFGAVVAQRSTGRILAGNHRYLAAQHEGIPAIPVLWIEVDDEAAVRILLADNRTSDLATYDDEALTGLLRALLEETGSLAGTGFDNEDLEALLDNVSQAVSNELENADNEQFLNDRYAILVTCESEEQQISLLQRFTADGLACRALVT